MRERSGIKSHNIDVLAALLLLCAFAMCILGVLLMGTRTYRDITTRDAEVFDSTTQALYVSTKLSQAEGPEAVSASQEEGVSCVVIDTVIGGEPYVTRIYCYDGWIRELFTKKTYAFSPQDGEKVSRALSLEAKVVDDLLVVTITGGQGTDLSGEIAAPGRVETVSYSLREGTL